MSSWVFFQVYAAAFYVGSCISQTESVDIENFGGGCSEFLHHTL